MNTRAKNVFRNLSYVFSANFLVLGISIVLNLVVPKFLGLQEYGFWQLYVFYSGYVGFLHFGWLDGIYLKIGGENYDDLDKGMLGIQFWYLLFFELLLSLFLTCYILFYVESSEKSIVLFLTAVVSIIINCKTYILYIFQSTNRIKEYAQLSRNDRYIYVVMAVAYLLLGGDNFIILISFDILSKLIITLYGAFKIKDLLVFNKYRNKKNITFEIIDNVKIGSSLMIGNIASMLIMGITRLFVEQQWSIEVFGKLSFTLSISNMFMIFINAVGVVMFPLLRRTDSKKIKILYLQLRNLFVPITFSLLLVYQPVKIILEKWLPNYQESLMYMGILFPMIIYEGRMSLLIGTYLKTIRKEKVVLYTNILSFLIAVIGSSITVFILHNLIGTIAIIMLVLIFRCILAELSLAKIMEFEIVKQAIIEIILTIIFIVSNLIFSSWFSFLLYFASFVLYILYNFKSIITSGRILMKTVKS